MRFLKSSIGWLCFLSLIAAIVFTFLWAFLTARPFFFGAKIYSASEPSIDQLSKYIAASGVRASDSAILKRYVTKEDEPGYGQDGIDAIMRVVVLGGPPKPVRVTGVAAALMDLNGNVVAAYPANLIGHKLPHTGYLVNHLRDRLKESMEPSDSIAWDGEFGRALGALLEGGNGSQDLEVSLVRDGSRTLGILATVRDPSRFAMASPEAYAYTPPAWVRAWSYHPGDRIPLLPAEVTQSIRDNSGYPPGFRVPIVPILAFPLFVLLMPIWAGFDAAWRGMRGWAWWILVSLTGLIGLVAYLIARQPDPRTCPNCGESVLGRYRRCPSCGLSMLPKCPICGTRMKPKWQYCPVCRGVEERRESNLVPSFAEAEIPCREQPRVIQERKENARLQVSVLDARNGVPVPNAGVTIKGPSLLNGLTNSVGKFEAGRLIAGDYVVIVHKEGYQPVQIERVVMPESSESLKLEVEAESACIAGRVVDQINGTPISGARVYIDSTRIDAECVTGDEGGFTLDCLPPEPYMIAVEADGYESASKLAVVRAGQRFPLDFELEAVCVDTSPADKEIANEQ